MVWWLRVGWLVGWLVGHFWVDWVEFGGCLVGLS